MYKDKNMNLSSEQPMNFISYGMRVQWTKKENLCKVRTSNDPIFMIMFD